MNDFDTLCDPLNSSKFYKSSELTEFTHSELDSGIRKLRPMKKLKSLRPQKRFKRTGSIAKAKSLVQLRRANAWKRLKFRDQPIKVFQEENENTMKQSRNVCNYRLKEGNSVSGTLPPTLDSFLQDIAQITGMIDYTDIMNFSTRATAEDIKKLRKLYKAAQEAAEYDDEDDYNDIARGVRKVVVTDLVESKKNMKEGFCTEAELDAIFNGGYEDWYDGIDPNPEKAKYIHKAAQDAGMSDLEYVNREEVLDQLDAENEFIYDLEASDVSVESFKIEAARNIFEDYKQEIEEKGSATGSYGHQMTDDYDLCEDILEGAELFINDNWINSFSSHSIEEMIAITAQYYNDPRCTKVKALYDALVEWASDFNALVEGYVTGFRTIDIVEPSGYVATETTDDFFDDSDSFEDYETDESSLYESKKLKEKFGVKGHYGIEVNAIAGKQYGFSTVDVNGKPNTDEEPFEAKTKEAVLASKMYAACVKRYGQDKVRIIKF